MADLETSGLSNMEYLPLPRTGTSHGDLRYIKSDKHRIPRPPELKLLMVDSETLGQTNTEYPHTQTIPLDLCVETEGYHLVQ